MVFTIDYFPNEIFYMIFEYLWGNEIFHSLFNINRRIDSAINSYNNYYLDFRNLHKMTYDYVLTNLIDKIKCLVISNAKSVPQFAHIKNFLTLFKLSKFIRLENLSLMDIDEEYFLVIIPNIFKFKKLRSLKLDRLPSYTGSRFYRMLPRLIRLDLPDASFFDRLTEEIIQNLKCLSINRCTFEQLKHLFNILPQRTLRSFALKNGILSTITNNEWPQFNRVPNQLKRINLQIDFQAVTFNELTNLLSQLPHLILIDIKGEGDVDLVDGLLWETFLSKMYGNQLISFDFCFTIWSYMDMNIDETLDIFSRPYWLNRVNPWYVAFNGRALFYTLPHYAVACNRSDVTISCLATTNDERLFFNSITQLIIHNPNQIPKYRFNNVKFLRISGDAYDSTIDKILSIVDLTRVKHLEISTTIPDKLLNLMTNLYRLSLININSLFLSLHKINPTLNFKQVRILDINYNATDHRYTDISPETLCPIFPNLIQLSIDGISIRRAYLNRIIDGFPKMIYGKFQINWDKQQKEDARRNLGRETCRLISYDNQTNFSCHFELFYLHLFIWDTQ